MKKVSLVDITAEAGVSPTTVYNNSGTREGSEFKPMVKAIIQEGKREGYVRHDVPDEVVMLYFDILRIGEMARSKEIGRVIADRDTALAFTRLIYFGLLQKEFALGFTHGGEST